MAERIAKVLPTQRLYEIHTTRDGKADPTSQFCIGAEPMLRVLRVFQAQAGDLKPLSQGCTHKREPRTDGGLQIEIGCDKAAGASFTSRLIMEADGQLKEIHQRMELQWEVEHSTRSTVAETRFVQAGACPADLKPGEMRMADGTKMDVMGLFAGPTASPPSAK